MSRKVKILLYDVESFPNLAYIWKKWEQNAIGDMVKEKKVVCFSYKWLGDKKIHHFSLPMFKGYKRNPDSNMALVKKLHSILSEADIVVAHNVDRFDDKMSNTDILKNGLLPPPPHKTVDTLKVAKKYFALNSNKLEDIGVFLGLGRKKPHSWQLWLDCMNGKPAAWAKMRVYNDGDVELLEKILLRFMPWIANWPDLRAGDRAGCVVCGHDKMQRRGVGRNKFCEYRRTQCTKCGHWDRERK